MTLAFFTNYVNHHQIPLADELYEILGTDYHYISICDTQELIKTMSGYSEIERPYIIRTSNNESAKIKAYDIAINADVVIYGTTESLEFIKARYKAGKKQLTFEVGERWLKRGLINLLSPRLLKSKLLYHTLCPKNSTFRLCASAYSAYDENLMMSFKNKCLKWGYFTKVPDIDIDVIQNLKRKDSSIKILWVSRFIKWKHPELMLKLAFQLRNLNVNFSIDMIGEGVLYEKIKKNIKKQNLQTHVNLLGVMPNKDIIIKMREYHIFCHTADRKEGWGAVLNEAMAAGCCPIACVSIGSAPFLIKNGINGFLFNQKIPDDLTNKVVWLINNRAECEQMSKLAYKTMNEVWNPKEAARRLVSYSKYFLTGNNYTYLDGPMSNANIL